MQGALKELIEPLGAGDGGLVDSVCSDILRAASRTASGGDSYTVVRAMLATDDSPLTPAPVKQAPILIEVDADSGKVHIETEDSFFLHSDEDAMIANAEAAAEEAAAAAAAAMGEETAGSGQDDGEKAKKFSGKALRHALGLSNFWGKKKTAKPPAPPKPILLVAKCEISIGIFDQTCQRRLAVTCPDIETCPPQCIVVGAGQSAVNGTYDMQGFRHDSPWCVLGVGTASRSHTKPTASPYLMCCSSSA